MNEKYEHEKDLISSEIRGAMGYNNITQKELSKLCEVHPMTIGNWLKNIDTMNLKNFRKLLDVLGLEMKIERKPL